MPKTNTKNQEAKNKGKIAIFPCIIKLKENEIEYGFNVGWINNSGYCFVWGNFETREKANQVLSREYPNAEIINYKSHRDCYHSRNRPQSGVREKL